LDELSLKTYNTFAAGLFERSKSARSKLTVSIGNLIVHHPERTQTKAVIARSHPKPKKNPPARPAGSLRDLIRRLAAIG
jgi:hypothetical protein